MMGENLLTSWEGPGKNLANPSGSGASKPWALGRPRKSGVSNHGVCYTQTHFCKSGGSSEWWVFYFFKLNLPYPLKQLFCILKSTNLMVNFLSSSHSQQHISPMGNKLISQPLILIFFFCLILSKIGWLIISSKMRGKKSTCLRKGSSIKSHHLEENCLWGLLDAICFAFLFLNQVITLIKKKRCKQNY